MKPNQMRFFSASSLKGCKLHVRTARAATSEGEAASVRVHLLSVDLNENWIISSKETNCRFIHIFCASAAL